MATAECAANTSDAQSEVFRIMQEHYGMARIDVVLVLFGKPQCSNDQTKGFNLGCCVASSLSNERPQVSGRDKPPARAKSAMPAR